MTPQEEAKRLGLYKKEHPIRSEDFQLLRTYASIGAVSLCRFRLDKNGQIIPCAKLTEQGRYIAKISKKHHSNRFFQALLDTLFNLHLK